MAWILHALLSLHNVIPTKWWHKLIALKHRVRYLIKVASTNNKDLGLSQSALNGLEVVWEVSLAVDCVVSDSLGLAVVDVELLWVLLHNKDGQFCVVILLLLLTYRGYLLLGLLKAFNCCFVVIILTLAIHQMLIDFIVSSLDISALWAWEDKFLKNLLDDSVHVN
jgi:hypothetical protein